MVLFAVQRLEAAGPLLAVHASHSFAEVIGFHWLELRVRVVVCRTRHCRVELFSSVTQLMLR